MKKSRLPKKMRKILDLPSDSVITAKIIQEVNNLFEYEYPCELKNSLLEIYMTYVINEHEALPVNFSKIAWDIYFLVSFLTEAEREIKALWKDKNP